MHVSCENSEKLAVFLENSAAALNFLANLRKSSVSCDFSSESWIFAVSPPNLAENRGFLLSVGLCLQYGVRALTNFAEIRDFLRNLEEILSKKLENCEILADFARKLALKVIYQLFCRGDLRLAQWLQKAVFYVSANFLQNSQLFTRILTLFGAGIREYRTSFLRFSQVFLHKSPNLLNYTVNALRFYARKTQKSEKSQEIHVF